MTAEVAEFVAPLALTQGKDVALLGETEPVWVKGNPEMLSRAIRNLAENAINHTAPGTTVEFFIDENGTVSVLDHGPGVAEDERNLIFQRFWRRDRRKAGSTGLGLSIVQRIAELHSATITLENRRPAGALFLAEIYSAESLACFPRKAPTEPPSLETRPMPTHQGKMEALRARPRQTGSRDRDDQRQATSDPRGRRAQQ